MSEGVVQVRLGLCRVRLWALCLSLVIKSKTWSRTQCELAWAQNTACASLLSLAVAPTYAAFLEHLFIPGSCKDAAGHRLQQIGSSQNRCGWMSSGSFTAISKHAIKCNGYEISVLPWTTVNLLVQDERI